jgi:hypothetical protein
LGSTQSVFVVEKAVPKSSSVQGAKARALITSNGRDAARSTSGADDLAATPSAAPR